MSIQDLPLKTNYQSIILSLTSRCQYQGRAYKPVQNLRG